MILRALALLVCTVLVTSTCAQIVPPYATGFDTSVEVAGWNTYSDSSATWELGLPSGQNLNQLTSYPNAWATDLDGPPVVPGLMYLESPEFDFSSVSDLILSFAHQFHFSGNLNSGGIVEYSLDGGMNWTRLYDESETFSSWHGNNLDITPLGTPGWSTSSFGNGFQYPAHGLSFLNGEPNVKFRFKTYCHSSIEGWLIDDFRIIANNPNVYTSDGQDVRAIKFDTTITVKFPLIEGGFGTPSFNNHIYYFLSSDSLYDPGDQFMGETQMIMSGTVADYEGEVSMPSAIPAGEYFIIHQLDGANLLSEASEVDNFGFSRLAVDSVVVPNFEEDFEDSYNLMVPMTGFQNYSVYSSPLNRWKKGNAHWPQIWGTHSGEFGWHHIPDYGNLTSNFLNFPVFDLTGRYGQVLCYWYKSQLHPGSTNGHLIRAKTNYAGFSEGNFNSETLATENPRFSDWECACHDLSFADNKERLSMRFEGLSVIAIDDIYVGEPKPDLTIERAHERTINPDLQQDTLAYYIYNSGAAYCPESLTKFYWSSDSIYDLGDVHLGDQVEPILSDTAYEYRKFGFDCPVSDYGQYYVIGIVDHGDQIDEMREGNNVAVFKVFAQPTLLVPYCNDFETDTNYWNHRPLYGQNDWKWTAPNSALLGSAFSGTQAFVASSSDTLSPESLSLLHSPVFDLSSVETPVLTFNMYQHEGASIPNAEGTFPNINIRYSLDNGANWHVLMPDSLNPSYSNWSFVGENTVVKPNDMFTSDPTDHGVFFDAYEPSLTYVNTFHGIDAESSTRYNVSLRPLAGEKNVQFRFNLVTKDDVNSYGLMVDDFCIKERNVDFKVNYQKALMVSSMKEQLEFSMLIDNDGTYASDTCLAHFYLSEDPFLSSDDYHLGVDTIMRVRPDRRFYMNTGFDTPTNFGDYNFLIYELDPEQINPESNFADNVGFWDLALDSISTLPYVQNFNDTIVDGWYQIGLQAGMPKSRFRFRNMIGLNEAVYHDELESGVMFTSSPDYYFEAGCSGLPHHFLESPVFNLSVYDSLTLSFNLQSIGRISGTYDEEGGTFDYSTDGGNTWSVLENTGQENLNWFSNNNVECFNHEPGWTDFWYPDSLQVVTTDISFLGGEENVAFRFRHKSNKRLYYWSLTLNGMYIDNFQIAGLGTDLIAINPNQTLSIALMESEISIPYSLTNQGDLTVNESLTRVYWSTDSVFDPGDELLLSFAEQSISIGQQLNASLQIDIPFPIEAQLYYALIVVDADNEIAEFDESNNIVIVPIDFGSFANYSVQQEVDTIIALIGQGSIDLNYQVENTGIAAGVTSNTTFYWSPYTNLSIWSVPIETLNQGPIQVGGVFNANASLEYPIPVEQSEYSIHLKVDDSELMAEGDEEDNIRRYVVDFTDFVGITDVDQPEINVSIVDRNIHVRVPGVMMGNADVLVYNLLGEIVLKSRRFSGMVQIPFEGISTGIYFVQVSYGQNRFTEKILIN